MKKLLGSLALFLALGGSVSGQVGNISNPVGANLNVQDAGTCLTLGSNLVQQLPINASTTTVTLAGTFTATVLVRESNNGGVNWTTAATLSSAGTTSYSTNGFSHLCVDITAYTSGVVQTTILTGLLQVQSVISGGSSVSPTGIPGTAGVTAVPVTSGLMAEYRIFPTETAAGLLDYSGNGRNATGTVGVAPAIIAGSGGISMNRNGAVSLPASLNSALTIMLVVNASDSPGTGIGLGSPIYGSAGPVANSAGLAFASTNQDSSQLSTAPVCCYLHALFGATPTNAQVSRAQAKGNTVVAWVMDTTDKLYTNGVLGTSASGLGNGNAGGGVSSAGVQTTGNFQLGGQTTSLFGITLYFTGSIYYAVFYNRVLSPTEIQQNTAYLQNAMAARGVPPIIYSTAAAQQDMLVLDGDSLTFGTSPANPSTPYSNYSFFSPASWTVETLGVPGQFVGAIDGNPSLGAINGAPTAVDPFFNPSGTRNAVVLWIGTNERTNFGGISGYCSARRKLGFKCFVVDLMSSNGVDAAKNTFNTWMRLNWPNFADGFMDVGSDPLLGADGASGSATWFNGGGPHLFTQGYANLVAPIIQRGIGRYYGNANFSSATTYVAPAAAAVAVTAATETGNTATFTTAANTFAVGQCATVAGVTPAGYNSPAGHCWQILTAPNSTTFTAYLPVTGLGVLTVAGTASVPQQLDVDTYSILNFGAGNFTLQSCMGYTGQNIYIRNINAVATTLVPFASEAITGIGAASATLAATSTAILQSQLVSSSAAGCNWVRLQ